MATIPLPASVGNPFEPLERLHALHERGRTGGPLWLLDDFMYMGQSTMPDGARCHDYKHCMSRRYLHVVPGGPRLQVYVSDVGSRGPLMRSYVHGVAWVLDGWTSAKIESVLAGLRRDLAKAVQS